MMNEPKITTQNVLSAISQLMQFILGFLLGVALIAAGAVGAAYYYFKKVSSTVPEKPIYPETVAETASDRSEDVETQPELESESATDIEPGSATTPQENIPPNAYYANVTWSEGLSLRAEPDIDSDRIGGVGYNARILILEDSADKNWQKIRIPSSQQEGWVKAGNVRKAAN